MEPLTLSLSALLLLIKILTEVAGTCISLGIDRTLAAPEVTQPHGLRDRSLLARQPTPIDRDNGSVDIVGRRRGEKHRGAA